MVVGGTTPKHIKAISDHVKNITPRKIPNIPNFTNLSGLEPLTIRPDSNFVNIGERPMSQVHQSLGN